MPQLLDPYANPDTDGVFDEMDPEEEEREDLLAVMYAHIQPVPVEPHTSLAGMVQTKARSEAKHTGSWDESKHPRGHGGRFEPGEYRQDTPGGSHERNLASRANEDEWRGREGISNTERVMMGNDYDAIERAYAQDDAIHQHHQMLKKELALAGGAEKVIGLVAERAGITRDAAVTFRDGWGKSSQTREALFLHAAAAEQYGFDLHPNFKGLVNAVVYAHLDVPQSRKMLDDAHKFLHAQRELTQEMFRRNNVTHVTVLRSVILTRPDDVKEFRMASQGKDVAEVSTRPISSWTVDAPFIANRASHPDNVTMISTVPVDRVAGTMATGLGHDWEGEMVLYDGRITVGHAGKFGR